MKLNNNTSRHGFTLVEIMIVVAIIGLLAAIAIPNFMLYRQASRKSVCIANLKQLQDAKTQWAFEKSMKSTQTPVEADLIGASSYLRYKPACPSGGDDYLTTIGTVVERASCTMRTVESHSL